MSMLLKHGVLLTGHQAGTFDEECSCHAQSALPVTPSPALLCGASSCDEVAHPGSQALAARRDWQQNTSLWTGRSCVAKSPEEHP